ncbi:uncharacterized protein A1O9_08178 [Exophiala aquamarina CBS 119918]|uniref:SCD domain-containing protein n=1 Tax=Exophiala aquamarina CBS 119918 TaxID=1182545 RepID=A0A072P817_9EURO|nr:uncharacterized protein A1O9_08178 [Exophiala aquamarina CBS 119918]KEF55428.1 hypothetical protein A1O9_08178 [Exophiala aquamarina CBS 119918]
MEVDSNSPNGAPESRRKSGRVVHKPNLFSQELHEGSILANGSTKRKRISRGSAPEQHDDDDDDDDSDDDDDEEQSEAEPDEEELRANRRVQKLKRPSGKPATKRTKTTNGSSTTLAIRPADKKGTAAGKGSKTQKARARPSQAHQLGLYAEVFGKGRTPDDAASVWFKSAQADNVGAIRDLVNFVLQCIGCDSRIENQDIEDLDSVPSKLGDVLQEYEQQKSPDYPLISKHKLYVGFQSVLEEFFNAVIKALHSSSYFYKHPELYDNIHVWIATMSGLNYKSFRHTATIVSLAMSTALCEVAEEIQGTMVTLKTQLDAENKKRSVNKGRVKTIGESQKAAEEMLEAVDNQLRDAVDTVFVHRYRDVEERIRAPCIAALGNWILLYRKMFLEGQYLRYLGWVLNDTAAATRLEDVKQLKNLFRTKKIVGALRAFADRFRPRLVEMGARDADVNVRVEAIELLDSLRDAELLEPDEVDTVGRLILDNEPRVRKAVARFFVSNIEDFYIATVEEFDEAQYHATLSDAADVDDFTVPTRQWIKFKCMGSILAALDSDDESLDGRDVQSLPLDLSDSRYALATQAIFPYMEDLQNWEGLAGYLLYDHSMIPDHGDEDDINYQVQQAYKLSAGEDIILLDILYSSIKLYLPSILESAPSRRTNASKDQIREKQESAAQNLTIILPQLLSKFGSTPQAASSILRIEQLLDIGLINDLQSGEATFAGILDDISKQFTSHSDKKVLAAASAAFRNARSFEQSKEAADAKVQEIWHDSIASLARLLRGKDIETRGTLELPLLGEVVNTVLRMAELAGVYDCTQVIEGRIDSAASKKQKGKSANQQVLLDFLLHLLKRGEPDEDTTDAFADLEDQLCTALLELFSRYFRWKVFGLKKAIEANDRSSLTASTLTNFAMMRTTFSSTLTPIIAMRTPLDPVRYNAIINVLELFALFTTVRNFRPEKGDLDEDVEQNLKSLITAVPEDLIKEVMITHEKLEKSFAKKTRRKIELADKKGKGKDKEHVEEEDIEKPPEDSDDEGAGSGAEADDSDEGDADTVPEGRSAKKQAALLAEQNLCEITSKIIFAVVGGAIKDRQVKTRLLLNRTKLGKNYTALLAYLDDKKEKKKAGGPTAAAKGAGAGVKKSKEAAASAEKEKKKGLSETRVLDEDDIEDDEDDEVNEEEEQHRRDLEEDEIEDGGAAASDDVEPREDANDDEIMGD